MQEITVTVEIVESARSVAYRLGSEHAARRIALGEIVPANLDEWGAVEHLPTILEVFEAATGTDYPDTLDDTTGEVVGEIGDAFELGYLHTYSEFGAPFARGVVVEPLGDVCNCGCARWNHSFLNSDGELRSSGGACDDCDNCRVFVKAGNDYADDDALCQGEHILLDHSTDLECCCECGGVVRGETAAATSAAWERHICNED